MNLQYLQQGKLENLIFQTAIYVGRHQNKAPFKFMPTGSAYDLEVQILISRYTPHEQEREKDICSSGFAPLPLWTRKLIQSKRRGGLGLGP